MNTKIEKLAYSIAEACSVTSLGRTTLYGHIAAGRLEAVHVGGRTVIPAESLKSLLGGGKADTVAGKGASGQEGEA
jgi:excisionase family DNA binding protein